MPRLILRGPWIALHALGLVLAGAVMRWWPHGLVGVAAIVLAFVMSRDVAEAMEG